jgi:NAD(P)-dependent dehydrogenase (short-subunit alcohol dehydrogenase family)
MKTAVVTGAAGGIGTALCAAFHRAGYRVIGIDRRASIARTDWENICFDIGRLADATAADAFVQALCEKLGRRIDVLVNNAAVQIVKPFEDLTADEWNESLQVNLLAPFWLVQKLAPALRCARGSVVNVASIHAEVTKPGFAAYSTTKGALVALTRALALELAPQVRVNAILPAATDTPMLRAGFTGHEPALERLAACHPMQRIARPDEVAAVALFLAAPECRFLTGEAIRVDGGIGAVLHDPVTAHGRSDGGSAGCSDAA